MSVESIYLDLFDRVVSYFNQESESTLGFHIKKRRIQSSLPLPFILSFPISYLLPLPLLIYYFHGFMFARMCGVDRIVLNLF